MNDLKNSSFGAEETFKDSAVIFYVIGMGFGTSFSLIEVDCFDWVKTRPWKRFLRAAIGGSLSYLIKRIFDALPMSDK